MHPPNLPNLTRAAVAEGPSPGAGGTDPCQQASASPTPPPAAHLAAIRRWAGKFIVFEGPDGSGKSTQFRRITELAAAAALPHCLVREPGGTVTGERIREVLLDKANTGMTLRCEMLLYMASRAELIERKIAPALARAELVLADRFVASTLAYQGAAGGLPGADIAAVARVATRGIMPDLVLLFDVDTPTAMRRMNRHGAGLDRMEAKGEAFHRLVRQGYLDQAKADPNRYAVLDASRPEHDVYTDLLTVLSRGRA